MATKAAKASWVYVPVLIEQGGISIRKSAILAVTEARGSVTITLSGTTTQLKLPGVSRARLMQLIEPPTRYDNDDDY